MFSLISSGAEDETLSDLVQSGLLDSVEGEALDRIAWLISEVLKTPAVLISLLDGARYWIRSELDIPADEILAALSGFHEAVSASDILEINDAHVDPSFFDSSIVERPDGVRFLAGAPIADMSGFNCGVITVLDVKPRKLSQDERTKLRCFADQVENEFKILSLMQEEANLRFEATKAFNAKSSFLSQMSHEIRTPIAGIIGATDLLLSGAHKETPELLNTIRTSATDLLQLLNEMLDCAKIEAGGLHIQSVPVDLVAVREKLQHHFHPLAEAKSLEFGVDLKLEGDLPEFIQSDPLRLRQIMFNVLHNAMKFTERGGVKCRIMLSPGECEGPARLTILVVDSGVGMSAAALENLFEPFRQGDEGDERSHEGTGLGMSLVKQLTERMKGEIEVTSTLGEGTTIRIVLPVDPIHDVWIAAAQMHDESMAPSRPAEVIQDNDISGMQVMIADDNPQNRLILEKVISSWGCDVTTAEDGEKALALALAHAFDAIILDLHMPAKSGFDVAREIRRYTSNTKLIACSADTTQAAYAKCQDAGFDHQIEKPFNWPKLYQALAMPRDPSTTCCVDDRFSYEESGAI